MDPIFNMSNCIIFAIIVVIVWPAIKIFFRILFGIVDGCFGCLVGLLKIIVVIILFIIFYNHFLKGCI